MKENDDNLLEENLNINQEQNSSNLNINSITNDSTRNSINKSKDIQEKNNIFEQKTYINEIFTPKGEKKDYNSIVKAFLSQNFSDTKYEEKIENDPMSLFETISVEKLKEWENSLSFISPNTKKISDQREQEREKHILSYPKDTKTQTVIKNDCKRTRVRESKIYPDFFFTLEKVITYYCLKNKVTYKQGLNEIFGPLVLLQYKIKKYSLVSIINLGAQLIDSFLPNYFYEKDIYSLKSALGLFILLLKYHEPTVYNRLDKLEVRPEIYATNWLIAYLSGKLNLNIFYELWDQIIKARDPLFIQFILVSIIKYYREMLINCEENYVASIMTCLTIKSKEELNNLIKIAIDLRKKTPYSFRILANKIGFLKKNYDKIKENYEKFQPDTIPAMPIFPSEILYITYKSEIDCIDSRCKNYIKSLEKNTPDFRLRTKLPSRAESRTVKEKNRAYNSGYLHFLDKNHLCEKCDMKIEKDMKYILLDLRILQYNEKEDDSDKTGYVPMMISVPQEELKSLDFSNIMVNRFITERGNYHFIFLTSSTDTFSNFEKNYYMDNISEEDRKRMMFGVIKQQKIDKELDINNAMEKLSLKQTYKLKEYDNMRTLLKSMIKHNFPYVGYVYDGFEGVHKTSKLFKLELLNHNIETCLLCNKHKNSNENLKESKNKEEEKEEKSELYKSLWEHKKKIKYKNLDIFFKNPNNRMHLCILKEYKGKNIENEQIQILINELFDKFEIEVYKFDKKKQYIDFENTIMIMEKKQKKEYYDLGVNEEDTNKDLELTLLENVSVVDIISISPHKSANIVNVTIRDYEKKDSIFGIFKKKENYITHTIVFDFSSDKDSKNFVQSFKELISEFKKKRK